MDLPKPPRDVVPQVANWEARTLALLKLKQEMQLLHARLEYLRIILKVGVRLP